MVDTPSKSIIFFRLGSSRATLLDLNNLFLAFLFAGFVCLIPYLFINEVTVFQPLYFINFFMEDPRPDYIAFFLHSIALPRSFALLSGSPSIYGPISLYRPTPEIIWPPGSVSHHSRYTPACLSSSVNASVPHPINLPVRPPARAPVGASGPVDNWARREYQPFIWPIDNYEPILVFPSISRLLGDYPHYFAAGFIILKWTKSFTPRF